MSNRSTFNPLYIEFVEAFADVLNEFASTFNPLYIEIFELIKPC